ncbi:hypothetical protein HY947_02605 [Candidatus Gottesmanbacteria bacterium]|nr:hypothetical protein [Candidatus Gottesmanbacteria bacterium]
MKKFIEKILLTNRFQVVMFVFVILYIALVFRGWFSFSLHVSGDFLYKFPEAVKDFPLFPSLWNSIIAGGLGGNASFLLGLESWYLASAKIFGFFGLGWEWVEKIIWFYPFLFISFLGSFFLGKRILHSSIWALISSVIYCTNTYVLMISGGGQIGVLLSVALAPWVLDRSLALLDHLSRKNIVYLSIVLAFQMLFDARMVFVTSMGIALLFFFQISSISWLKDRLLYLGISFFFAFGLLSWWLLPFVFSPHETLSSMGLSSVSLSAVRYFSFAPFEHAISLLHPNWPENIFGKIHFLQPEFLLLPFLAFLSLSFIHKSETKRYLYIGFVITALVGAFLAKGSQPPFGNIYEYLYMHVPGFSLFRDPTKFLLLVALSYSVLIPYTLQRFAEIIKTKYGNKKERTVVGILILFFIFLWGTVHREIFTPGLGGTFQEHGVNIEYTQLKDFLLKDKEFGRMLWVPTTHKLGFSSGLHPSISAMDVLKSTNSAELFDRLQNSETLRKLEEWAVSYIVVPEDTSAEIFATDRRYDDKKYQEALRAMEIVPGFHVAAQLGKIVVFQSNLPVRHVWIIGDGNISVSAEYKKLSNTSYILDKPIGITLTALYLSERYDPGWVARIGDLRIASTKTDTNINMFNIPDGASDSILIEYEPQKYVIAGMILSILTGCAMAVYFFNRKL